MAELLSEASAFTSGFAVDTASWAGAALLPLSGTALSAGIGAVAPVTTGIFNPFALCARAALMSLIFIIILPFNRQNYFASFSLMLMWHWSPITIWSSTSMPIILPSFIKTTVDSMSSMLGAGSPDGWLWHSIANDAL